MNKKRVERRKKDKLSKRKIILIALAIVLIPMLVYGSNVGLRLYNIYSAISTDIDDFVPMDPVDFDQDIEEVEGDEIPTDEVEKIKYLDDPIYAQRSEKDSNKLNILLVGADKMGDQGGHRSDTIMVVQFDKTTKKSAILSIPRDTYVKIPGRGYDKVNHAYAFGGPRLLKETLEGFLDIHIDNYAQVGMDGFGAIVDELGGMTINVAHDMVDTRNGETLFKKGIQHMEGEEALMYVRARHLTVGGSDFGRIRRQQQVMINIFSSIKSNMSLNKSLNMLEAMSPYLRTDITPATVVSNWSSFTSVDPSTIKLQTLEGEGFIHKKIYYYRVPIEDARTAMKQITN